MPKTSKITLIKQFCSLVFILGIVTTSFTQKQSKKPNIILILADDLGWKDLSCYGSSFYETPYLDSLATNGIKFTQAYAASPVCSPTRASLLTGKYPTKTGVTDWIKGRQENGKAKPYEKFICPETAYQLALEETTIAEFALQNGYQTFFAGKWHLGEEEKYWPQHQGFLQNKGGWSKGSPNGRINDSTGGFFTPYKNPTLGDGQKGEYLTDRLTNECLDFITQSANKPFLLFHSFYAVHNPLQAPKHLIDKYIRKASLLPDSLKNKFITNELWMINDKDWKTRITQNNAKYAAMIENMDWNIGRIIEKLRQQNLLDNTLIIFTSDNGGLSTAEGSPTSNEPLRAGKGWVYEGGIRIPLIVYWKNKMPKSIETNLPVNTVDIFPTIAKAISAVYKPPTKVDGADIFTMLLQKDKYKKRTLFWHYPHYSKQGGKPATALLANNYKLIYNYENKSYELYNLAKDIGEKNNLFNTNSTLSTQLKTVLQNWINANQKLPFKTNPNFKDN